VARYSKTDDSERRTAKVTVQLAPTERQRLEKEAQRAGAALSEHVRHLCLRRGGARVGTIARTRRNPEAKGLMDELRAIGINLNQLTRHANTSGAMPEARELRDVIEILKAAMGRVLAL
jgi:hypothetical protein